MDQKINWAQKLSSRKFWICVAAFLASIATSIVGLNSNNTTVTTIGAVCGIISAAIYAAAEAYVDGNRIKAKEGTDNDEVPIH